MSVDGSAETPAPDPTAEVRRLVTEARADWEQRRFADSEAPLCRALELAEGVGGIDDPWVGVVLSHLARLAGVRERHEEAVALYRRSLRIREARFGPGHPETIRAVEELAAALFQADAHADADALGLRAVAAREAAGGEDAALADAVAAVAWRRYWVGRYAEAEPLFLRPGPARAAFWACSRGHGPHGEAVGDHV